MPHLSLIPCWAWGTLEVQTTGSLCSCGCSFSCCPHCCARHTPLPRTWRWWQTQVPGPDALRPQSGRQQGSGSRGILWAPARESRGGATRGTNIWAADSRKHLGRSSLSLGVSPWVCLQAQTGAGASPGACFRLLVRSSQPRDSGALFRLLGFETLEIISLTDPTRRKLSDPSWEPSGSHPVGAARPESLSLRLLGWQFC